MLRLPVFVSWFCKLYGRDKIIFRNVELSFGCCLSRWLCSAVLGHETLFGWRLKMRFGSIRGLSGSLVLLVRLEGLVGGPLLVMVECQAVVV